MYHYDPERESRDFQQILASGRLPPPRTPDHQEAAQRAGIVFHETGPLCHVTLPQGWRARQVGSSWGHLVDNAGYVRAQFSYGDDRNYDFKMLCRYRVSKSEGAPTAEDTATRRIIFRLDPGVDSYFVRQWLSENFPEWEDPLAYWDEQPFQTPWWRF